MLIVGLTGGIASGKSAAASRFAELGVPVVDADIVARQVVEPGEPGLDAITATFGTQLLNTEGQLNRAALRQLVFSNPVARRQLEAILHPLIRERMDQALRSASGPYAVEVIPLLVEQQMQDQVSRVLVVDAPESIQQERAQARDKAQPEHIHAVIASQVSRHDRLAIADDVINNTGSYDDLHRAVDALHEKYLTMATGKDRQAPANG